jgi:DNA helicase HerA-like ATPase
MQVSLVRSASDARDRGFLGETLGHVVSIDGSRAVIATSGRGFGQHTNSLSVGRLVTIDAGLSSIVGMVHAATADTGNSNATLIKVDLVGEITPGDGGRGPSFDRGIRNYPPVGAVANRMESADLQTIYDRAGSDSVVVGSLSQDASIDASLSVRDLLQKHFAVVGTTGCGKSSAVSVILHEILRVSESTRILLFDPHNEYKTAFLGQAEVVSPKNLNLPFWLFNFEEITDVFYRRRPGVEEEVDVLADLIPLAKARYGTKREERASSLLKREAVDDVGYTVDSPVPYRISDLVALIDEQLARLDGKEDRPKLRRLKQRIQSVAQDPRYQFMFSNRTIEDTMAGLLKTIFRIPTAGRPLTIVEMAGFPPEVVDAVVSVLCRMAFDLGTWGNGRIPLLVCCEEAHRYVPADKRMGFGPTRRAISRIAKEGRKYGVYLGMVTQRPAELDATILSQCSTIFAMRMANEMDHAIIRSAVSDAAASMLESLPSMGNREALAFGEAVPMPMRVRFASLSPDQLPNSKAPDLGSELSDAKTGDFVEDVVRRWRAVAQRG